MTSLPELLRQLEGEWSRHDMDIARQLRPGLSEQGILARCARYGLMPSQAALGWYSWHDGADLDPDGDGELIPDRWPLQLEAALDSHATFLMTNGPDLMIRQRLPIASTGHGSLVVLGCGFDGTTATSSGDAALVPGSIPTPSHARATDIDTDLQPRPPERWPTAEEIVQWWIDRFRDNRWTWSGGTLSNTEILPNASPAYRSGLI